MDGRKNKTVSLVLGSGGARGLAHVGVIHWLEENGYSIASISGCSMGALVGGVFAAGRLNEYERWARAMTQKDILSLLDIAWASNGILKGERVIDALKTLVGDLAIGDLPIPFTAVATDWKKHREVWIQSGPLFDAIRASISVPILFTPFPFNGSELVDGGILNPVPITPTLRDQTDVTIAVDAVGRSNATRDFLSPVDLAGREKSQMRERLERYISQLKERFGVTESRTWPAFEIVNEAFQAMQSTISRMKTAASPPDHLIEIPRNACGMLDFHRANEMIALGYELAGESLAS